MKKLKLFLFVSFLFLIIISKAQHTIEVKHTYYTLEYDTSLKSPLISWYIQTTAHATSDNKIDRSTTATFHPDPLIDVNYQVATNKEYSSYNSQHRTDGLRFDKGHLSPFSAFNFDLTAAKESMYFTNTAPQYSFFNEHPWEKLEQHILKQLSPQYDSIYVYTGCLYGSDLMNDVPVADYYWKVIVYNGTEQAWVGKNEQTSDTDYTRYEISISTLKELIGSYYPDLVLDF